MGNTTINPKRSWETNFNERFQAARQGLLKLLSEVEGLSSIADAQSTGVSTKTALPAPDPPAFARRLADAAAVLEMRVKG
ncbi:hypothetical protein N9997_01265 [Synechococcus sp. AH-603-L18]|nr:hypothetical protein [Synechococcus sp. AH-603-L18]MDB4337951.1 hypothetical protein [Synechococcus sp. AH-603-L18]